MKPVQTGCQGRLLRAPDLEFCLKMAGLHLSSLEQNLLCPARYRSACSPHLAAEWEGKPIRIDRLIRRWKVLCETHETVIAEGAGGLLVPLNHRWLLIDLIARFGAPVLLVVRNRLGALNHTLLSLDALQVRRLPVAGYVLVEDPETPRKIRESNEKTLRRIASAYWLGTLPYMSHLAVSPPDPELFQRDTHCFAVAVWSALGVKQPSVPSNEPFRGRRPPMTRAAP